MPLDLEALSDVFYSAPFLTTSLRTAFTRSSPWWPLSPWRPFSQIWGWLINMICPDQGKGHRLWLSMGMPELPLFLTTSMEALVPLTERESLESSAVLGEFTFRMVCITPNNWDCPPQILPCWGWQGASGRSFHPFISRFVGRNWQIFLWDNQETHQRKFFYACWWQSRWCGCRATGPAVRACALGSYRFGKYFSI